MAYAILSAAFLIALAVAYRFLSASRRGEAIRQGLEARVRSGEAELHQKDGEIRQLNRHLKRQAEETRMGERQWQTLAEGLADGVARFDVSGRFVYANARLAGELGLEPDSLKGKRPSEVPGLVDAEYLDEQVGRGVRLGQAGILERRIGQDNPPSWRQLILLPERGEDGSVAFVQVVIRDISGQKATEDALAESRALADRRGEILDRLGHDLRTPLNGVLGHVQLLARDRFLTDRQQENLAVIRDSGDRLLDKLNDILQRVRDGARASNPPLNTPPNPPVVAEAPAPAQIEAWPAPPPRAALEQLHHLAELGNMRNLIGEARRIEAMDPGYHDFASRLRSLAEAYESRAIVAFVKHYLED